MALASLIRGTLFSRDFVVRSIIAEGGMDAACHAERRSGPRPLGTGTHRGTHGA